MQIYLLTNTTNGKYYVGQTRQELSHYLYEQGYRARNSICSKPKLYAAIRKHGIENFKIQTLMECQSQVELDLAEIAFIYLLQSQKIGYNIADGGCGNSGCPPWNKGKKCPGISKAMLGNTNGRYRHNRILSLVTRKKISETLKSRGIKPTIAACRAGGKARQARSLSPRTNSETG